MTEFMTWEDLKGEPTEDLIGYVQCKIELAYLQLANAAFEALTYRFQQGIVDRCRKVGKKYGYDSEESDLVAHKAFERFYRYPFKFEAGKCKGLNIDNCFTLYLYKIAQRCFFDHYNAQHSNHASPYDGTEEIVVDLPLLEDLNLDADQLEFAEKQRGLIDKALNNLSPKHKIIYCTYLAHEQKGFKLPRPLLAKLRDVLELDQDSIRVYKLEAKKEIQKVIKEDGKKK